MTSEVVPVLPLVPHWIGGKANGGSGERVGDVYDPSTGKLTKQVAFASSADVDEAVAAASDAFSAGATRRSPSARNCSSPSDSSRTSGPMSWPRLSPLSTARCSTTPWAR